MSKLIKTFGAAVTISAALLLSACGTSTPNRSNKNLTIAINSSWSTWNPYGASNNYMDIMSDMVYDKLLINLKDGTTKPRLATSYDVAEDHKSITFHLNPNAKFSDGHPVTADDVVFSFETETNPQFQSVRKSRAKYFAGTDESGTTIPGETPGVEKIDDHAVKFTFKYPMSEVPVLNSFNRYFYVIPKHIYGKYSIDELNQSETWKKNMVGSGPAIFESTVDGAAVEFKPNPNYYLGKPDFDHLTIKVVQGSQLLSGLMAKEIDVVAGAGISSIPLSDWDAAKNDKDLVAFSAVTPAYQAMIYNTQSPRLSNPTVRRAIDTAINRQNIVDNLLKGEGKAIHVPYPDFGPYYAKDLVYPVYDPDKAQKELQEAGFDFDQPLDLIVPTGNEIRIQSTVLIQQDLAKIGVKINITQYDFATLMNKMRKGEFDLGMIGAAGSVDPTEPGEWLDSRSATNFPNIRDDRYSKLYQKAVVELDPEKQKQDYADIQQLILDDLPISYLYSQNSLLAYNRSWENLDADTFSQLNWKVWEWKKVK